MKLRRSRIPSDIARQLPRAARSNAVELANGRWAAITPTALLVADESGATRHPWVLWTAAHWDGDRRLLMFQPVDGRTAPLHLTLSSDAVYTFTTAVRERIESSIVHHEERDLGAGMIQVLIRRTESGELISQTIWNGPQEAPSHALDDIAQLEASAREAVGLSRAGTPARPVR
ncbi:MAG: hypothetical protein Q4P36_00855 [Bowdeniella nasicola]|nr:hypothetical protein [Bowdeniella nasicola]